MARGVGMPEIATISKIRNIFTLVIYIAYCLLCMHLAFADQLWRFDYMISFEIDLATDYAAVAMIVVRGEYPNKHTF
jgi:hypothetical protein